ncbi:hypothetical protein XENOCAPTIV_021421 [Xenoophorus captivus]|uniref:Uncharacterized protein n=1 Tax=Xenoophorus captivus TaxID=1517983 RepID=A0ABV0RID7_9TELE
MQSEALRKIQTKAEAEISREGGRENVCLPPRARENKNIKNKETLSLEQNVTSAARLCRAPQTEVITSAVALCSSEELTEQHKLATRHRTSMMCWVQTGSGDPATNESQIIYLSVGIRHFTKDLCG